MKILIPIKVIRWMSETSFKTYIFDTSNEFITNDDITVIKENIYQDDNIEYAINKIVHFIRTLDKDVSKSFYSWSKKEPILFDIEDIKWKGYNVNPFKSKDRNSEELKEPISYIYKNGLFNKKSINIVFFSDFESKNKYYFIDDKNPDTNFKKRELLMSEIYNKPLLNTKILSETYHRIDLCATLQNPLNLSNIFDLSNTNANIQLIQWCNDDSHVLYKLHKSHTFKEKFLNKIMNLDKIRVFNCINIFSLMSNGTFCKACIFKNGMVLLSYILDLRSSINWNDMTNNKNMVVKYIQNLTKKPIHLKEININVNIYYNIDNSSFAVLSKKIGEYIDIFHVVTLLTEKKTNKIICIYKRSSNYDKEPINISEYIQSRLNLGINEKDLITELINLGINKNDVEGLINNEISNKYLLQQIDTVKIPNTGTIISIEKYKQGYMVEISNCVSKQELKSLLFWLSRIIENTRIIVKNVAKIEIKKESPQIDKSSSKSSSRSSNSLIDDNIGNKSFDLGTDDDFFQGGALGKQKHGYFMNLLKNADKELFGENYARQKCQAAFQPLVLSKEEKENLEKQDMIKHFDNIIQHGSKPTLQNFYTCPRLWCPESKIPLDYTNPDAKCPIENEEPMKLYWNKDITKPRYAKLTPPDENGISVPCCFKKQFSKNDVVKKPQNDPVKQSDSKHKEVEIDKDENYIMNKIAPIPQGRYGIIPEKLHRILLPNYDFNNCSKTLNKTDKCIIRKGIVHKKKHIANHKDSIIYSIAYLLGFKDKNSFIQDIRTKLDIITFISLEDGNVCKDFLDTNPILQDENAKLCKMFIKNIDNNLFDISDLKCGVESFKLSRLLNIYKSYLKFLDFLSSDIYPQDKGATYLYSLLSSLYNVLLVVWEKDDNDINMLCPIYTSYNDILPGLDLEPLFIMVIKDGSYYEPLEMKLRHTDGDKIFRLNDFMNLKMILNQCDEIKNKKPKSDFHSLLALSNFIKTDTMKNSKAFSIKTIIINNDLTIDKFMTKSNIIITTNKISISLLSSLIKNMDIKKIVFYDDIADKQFKVNIVKSDLETFKVQCKNNNIDINYGVPTDEKIKDSFNIFNNLVLKKQLIKDDYIIHSDMKNIYHDYKDNDTRSTKKWFQLQKMVANKLLSTYTDKKLSILNMKNRTEIITELLKHFSNIPNNEKKTVQIILEEVPLYSIKHIQDWYNNILLYIKYDLYSGVIKEKKNYFVFSQQNVNEKIPQKLLMYHKSTPTKTLDDKIQTKQYILQDAKHTINSIEELPELYMGTPEKLKSKWTKHKKLIWDKMILRRINYTKNTIPEFFNWLSKKLKYTIDYTEIVRVSWVKYLNILENKDVMMNLFNDNTFYNQYIEKMNLYNKTKTKNYKIPQLFWDNCYKHIDIKDKKIIMDNVLKDNKFFPNDINLLTITELINISILIIHRAKYGQSSGDVKRGEIEDLILSSTLIPAKSNFDNRPFIILSKEFDKNNCCYYSVTENDKNIYIQYKDVPNDIKALVDAHKK